MQEPFAGPLPRLRGTQLGLLHPEQIDQLKADMLNGLFKYEALEAIVVGVVDPKGTFHVQSGHHRIAAAIELMKETGNEYYLRMLLACGRWPVITYFPHNSRPLPGRDWISRLRNKFRI